MFGAEPQCVGSIVSPADYTPADNVCCKFIGTADC